MSKISIIVAMDKNRGIGKDNQLLCHLPADLTFFKKTTMGKPIVMGRKTYESIGKPLPGRQNIVISTQKYLNIQGVDVVDCLESAIAIADKHDEIMIIGGAMIYRSALALADRLYITKIHHEFAADCHFPPIDKTMWHCTNCDLRAKDKTNLYDLSFQTWEKVNQSSKSNISS
jgi:dihydrofolate reductase